MATIGVLWVVLIGLYIVTSLARVSLYLIPSFFILLLSVLSFLVSFGMPMWLAWVSPKEEEARLIIEESDDENITEGFLEDDEPQESKDARDLLKKGERVEDVILLDTEWTKLFKEFLEVRMCEEGFLFWQEVVKFRDLEEQFVQTEFTRIRQKFIGSGARFQINISDLMVKAISVRVEEGRVGKDIFDQAFEENRKVLVTDVFPAWKAWKKTKEMVGKLKEKTDPAHWPRRNSTRPRPTV
jgi:hypothetical protein